MDDRRAKIVLIALANVPLDSPIQSAFYSFYVRDRGRHDFARRSTRPTDAEVRLPLVRSRGTLRPKGRCSGRHA